MLMRCTNCTVGLSNIKWINTMLVCLNFIGPYQWLDAKHVTLVFKNIFLFYLFFFFCFLLILLDKVEVELSDDENKAFIVKVEAHRKCCCSELMLETSIPMLSSLSLVQIIPQFELFGSFCFEGGGFALWC